MRRGITFEDALAVPKRQLDPCLHSMKTFVPFLNPEGILRGGGRLDYSSDLAKEAKHSALLPPDHKITKLFILDRYQRLAHRSAE